MARVPTLIIFDFETGGLDATKAACTEIALQCIDGETLREVGRYTSYIAPYVAEYTQVALDYTGITIEKLNTEGKPIQQVGKEIFEWVKEMRQLTDTSSYTKKPVMVGHNVIFDIGFMQQLAKESKCDILSQFDSKKSYHGEIPIYLDTVVLSKLAWGNDETQTSFNLGSCLGRIGSEVHDAHKAINDVISTKDLLCYFINKMRSESITQNKESEIRLRDQIKFEF